MLHKKVFGSWFFVMESLRSVSEKKRSCLWNRKPLTKRFTSAV